MISIQEGNSLIVSCFHWDWNRCSGTGKISLS